eukprot:g1420.t1
MADILTALSYLNELRKACAEAEANETSCRRYGERLGALEEPFRQLQRQGSLRGRQNVALKSALELIEESSDYIRQFRRGQGSASLLTHFRHVWNRDGDAKAFVEFNTRLNQVILDLGFQKMMQVDAVRQAHEDHDDMLADNRALQGALEAAPQQHAAELREIRARAAGATGATSGGDGGGAATLGLPRLTDAYEEHPEKGDNTPAVLGKGSFGEVVRCHSRRNPRELVAAKCMEISQAKGAGLNTADFEREATALRRLNHENIVRFFGNFADGNGTRFRPHLFCMVMEYAPGGSVAQAVRAGGIDEATARKWLLQLCAALHHMHRECRIWHRDLKPDNLLLSARRDVKICDLGLACIVTTGVSAKFSRAGTGMYMSPEKARGRRYDEKDDMWAAGCIAAELVTLTPTSKYTPLGLHSALEQLPEVVAAVQRRHGGRFAALARQLLQADPGKRLAAAEAGRVLDGSAAAEERARERARSFVREGGSEAARAAESMASASVSAPASASASAAAQAEAGSGSGAGGGAKGEASPARTPTPSPGAGADGGGGGKQNSKGRGRTRNPSHSHFSHGRHAAKGGGAHLTDVVSMLGHKRGSVTNVAPQVTRSGSPLGVGAGAGASAGAGAGAGA